MPEILFLIIGTVLGGAIAWLIAKNNSNKEISRMQGELHSARESIQRLELQSTQVKSDSEQDKKRIIELTGKLSSSEANLDHLRIRLKDQESDFLKLQERFTAEFKNLAQEIFEEKSKKFTDQNKVNIAEILNPLKEKITQFEDKVEKSTKENLERNTALKEQITSLKELNQQITREAENLVRALKGDSKAQGNWGEMILESILEKSGLVKDREYFIQESHTGTDGKRYQPDVIIRLPENKNIIIDAKVSLTAYERFSSAETDQEAESQAKNHLLSIRNHLKGLSEKKYQNIYGITGLDFVLLFIPIEPAFGLAVQRDPALFNDAYEKNIVIVSPSTLIATLRTIHSIWRQEYQNQNALEIARQSGLLYDKFVGFTEDLIDVGKKLKNTKDSYDGAMNKLSTGAGNLVKKTEDLKKLGAKASKSIDSKLINRAIEEK